ncbi:MAG: aminotransferase class IV [Bacteroidota bacterium]
MLQSFDRRNQSLNIWVGDRLYPRQEAKISVFDSVVQGGDAVWEGLRLYPEGIYLLDRHLKRLFDSAKALHFTDIPDEDYVRTALRQTLVSNEMDRDVHVRLTLTRGEKITSGMDPRLNQSGSCLIILAEWKPPVYDNQNGITVITSAIRRNNPSFLDSKIHHNNLLNNILAKIQANVAGADAALMLDYAGFAAELNGTNLFIINDDVVFTPHADACLHGITRGIVMELCHDSGIKCIEKNISIAELYAADAAFCTGTMGELTPIASIDGRVISGSASHGVFRQLNQSFVRSIPDRCIVP